MSATDQCQVRRCRHARAEHKAETVHYTRQDGKPGSFVGYFACTVPGCTCEGFSMFNALQPTIPCRKCGEEFLPGGRHRLCPECRKTRRSFRVADVVDFIAVRSAE
jgi:hypothetical protein